MMTQNLKKCNYVFCLKFLQILEIYSYKIHLPIFISKHINFINNMFTLLNYQL